MSWPDEEVTPVYAIGHGAYREALWLLPFPAMIWMPRGTDPGDSILVFANKKAADFSGMPVNWMSSSTMREVFPEQLDEPPECNVAEGILRVWRTGHAGEMVTEYTNGSIRLQKQTINLYKIALGVVAIYRTESIITDIALPFA